MAKSLALAQIPTLNPDSDEETSRFDQAILRVLNNNFRAIALALNGNQDTANGLEAAVANAQLGAFTGAFIDYVPVLSQPGTITKTVTSSRYFTIGSLVVYTWHITVTGAGTAANAVLLTVPATIANYTTNPVIGSGYYYDASAGVTYSGPLAAASNFQVQIFNHNAGSPVGINPNFATANTDTHSGFVLYESA